MNNKSSPPPPSCVAIDGDKIKSIRESKGLTQLYVATVLGVTVDTVSRWENRRSPSIKLENAEKLSLVLEVSLEDLSESSSECSGGKVAIEPPVIDDANRPAGLGWPVIVSIFSVILLVGFGLKLLYFSQPVVGKVQANRLLPRHASPAQPFPVIIRVQSVDHQPVSFILKERIPPTALVKRGEPPFVEGSGDPVTIKWLSSTEGNLEFFAYLVQARTGIGEGHRLHFNGQITVTGEHDDEQPVAGSDSVELTHFHWADTNKDQTIDDGEILTIYNSFETLGKLGVDIDEIRQIWTSNGYRWNVTEKRFEVLP